MTQVLKFHYFILALSPPATTDWTSSGEPHSNVQPQLHMVTLLLNASVEASRNLLTYWNGTSDMKLTVRQSYTAGSTNSTLTKWAFAFPQNGFKQRLEDRFRLYLQKPHLVPPSKMNPFGTAPYRRRSESFHCPMTLGGRSLARTRMSLQKCRVAGPLSSLVPGATKTWNLWTIK